MPLWWCWFKEKNEPQPPKKANTKRVFWSRRGIKCKFVEMDSCITSQGVIFQIMFWGVCVRVRVFHGGAHVSTKMMFTLRSLVGL